MKLKELKEKYLGMKISELRKELETLEAELVKRQLEKKMAKLKQTHLIGQLHYQIALVKTLIGEKRGGVKKGE